MSAIFSIIKSKRVSCARGGFSLIEMLIYIGMLMLLLTAILTVGNLMLHSYGQALARKAITTSGESVVERMTRDIRAANSIASGSVFGSSPGDLKLATTDLSGNPTTVEYSVSGGALNVSVGGGAASPLLQNGVTVQSLLFTSTTTTHSTGVSIFLTLQVQSTYQTVTATFYDTAILRNSIN